MKWIELLGKSVIAFRGYKTKKFGKDYIPVDYILFDDGETYIQLEEQSPYDYHDCCSRARILNIYKDQTIWNDLIEMKRGIAEVPVDTTT